jgi:hypothetical protein
MGNVSPVHSPWQHPRADQMPAAVLPYVGPGEVGIGQLLAVDCSVVSGYGFTGLFGPRCRPVRLRFSYALAIFYGPAGVGHIGSVVVRSSGAIMDDVLTGYARFCFGVR